MEHNPEKSRTRNHPLRILGRVAVLREERAIKRADQVPGELPPLWTQPVHFYGPSPEATLALPEETYLTSQDIVDIVLEQPVDNS